MDPSDAELLDAACGAPLDAVMALLDRGANVNAVDESDGRSVLLKACGRQDEECAAVVRALLSRKAIWRMADNQGHGPLHVAARFCPSPVVQMLLDAGARVEALTNTGDTALHMAVTRGDAHAVEVVRLLLSRGAVVDCCNSAAVTPLLYACQHGSLDVVAELIDAGANARQRGPAGITTLMLAARNACFGELLIPALVKHGASLGDKDFAGLTVVNYALSTNGAVLRALHACSAVAPSKGALLPVVKWVTPSQCGADPIGVLQEARPWAVEPTVGQVSAAIKEAPELCVALMRATTSLVLNNVAGSDFFLCLAASDDVRLWQQVASELGPLRHPVTGNTLLHVACLADRSVAIVASLCARNINPLVGNTAGQLAVDVAKNPEVVDMLRQYAQWRPSRVCAEWYGPYFVRRAFVAMLLLRRNRVPRDVALTVVAYLSRHEYTWVLRRKM